MAEFNWADLIKDASTAGSAFEPLPDGVYNLKVENCTHKMTSTDKVMFTITAVVQNGPHANRKLWDNIVVSPDNGAALGFFFRKMKALGLGAEYFASDPTEDAIAIAVMGAEFQGGVGQKKNTNTGKDGNAIMEYLAPVNGGGGLGAPAVGGPQQPPVPQQQQQQPQAPQQQPQAPQQQPQAPQYADPQVPAFPGQVEPQAPQQQPQAQPQTPWGAAGQQQPQANAYGAPPAPPFPTI